MLLNIINLIKNFFFFTGSYSNNVLPTSDGKTPIGLCIAPTGFFGQNEWI